MEVPQHDPGAPVWCLGDEGEALLLNKHAIFNAPLTKIVITGYITTA